MCLIVVCFLRVCVGEATGLSVMVSVWFIVVALGVVGMVCGIRAVLVEEDEVVSIAVVFGVVGCL